MNFESMTIYIREDTKKALQEYMKQEQKTGFKKAFIYDKLIQEILKGVTK